MNIAWAFMFGVWFTFILLDWRQRLPPEVTLKMLPWTPEPEPEVLQYREHRRAVGGVVGKFKTAAMVGGSVSFNREGCAAMANLLMKLTYIADKSVDAGLTKPMPKDLTTP